MDLGGIMLSAISQTEKEKYYINSLLYEIYVKQKQQQKSPKFIEKEIRHLVTTGIGWRRGDSIKVVQMYKFPVVGTRDVEYNRMTVVGTAL